MKLALSILLFSLMSIPQGFNDRRILVIVSSEHNPEIQNQIDLLEKNSMELEKRRLAVYTIIDGKIDPVINPSKKSKKFLNDNKTDYTATLNSKTYLIGLDKSIKQTFTDFIQPQQIFNVVDRMPMRQAEMRKN
ncbi:DUF4174 domain-containing protein [Psychroflexus lacisalsi]|jgi:hypothetical protein|uniref:DUF4174 domain-containing protein n=1 Tax=Psychroflexus lacisalsi TaxID=503928 RepID=A0ABP3VF01_9FLAO|nr:DUF4174 domain-containing protein [Psychroflexus lacisalsi]MBZ9619485.1 DUF4174 domain-containing protein [Psychroflexus lacisalsi]